MTPFSPETREAPMPRYAAGWNMPGYLPDSPDSVGEFDALDDAKSYLADELDRDTDLDEGVRAEAIDVVKGLTAPDTVLAGDWAWWIQEVGA